jgi:hypothetical protein
MPDSKAGANNRLKQILSGGVKQRTMDRLEGEQKDIYLHRPPDSHEERICFYVMQKNIKIKSYDH